MKRKIALALLFLGFAFMMRAEAVPVFTRSCNWSIYTMLAEKYWCTSCCGTNSTSCEDQKNDCYGSCNSITSYCDDIKDNCNDTCADVYDDCRSNCTGKNKNTCRAACRDAKDDCNNDCENAETTCMASSYNFGGSIGTAVGYNGCRAICNTARDVCTAAFGTGGDCTGYCNGLATPSPTPTPTPTPVPSPTPTPTPSPTPNPNICNPATCCSGGWGGYTVDNGRGSHANPAQSTTAFILDQNKSTNMSIDTTRGAISTIVRKNGVPTVQTTTERNASFNQLISNPGIFNGSRPALFNFARYKAAAMATGNYFSSWCGFQNTVITPQQQRYGIVYVDLQKNESCFTSSTLHRVQSGSINVIGTFAMGLNGFANINEQRNFKIAMEVPMYINPTNGPITGSKALDYKDFAAFKASAEAGTFNPSGAGSAYETAWSTTIPAQGKSPFGVALGAGLQPFSADEDLPAVMYQDSIFDIEGSINASGAIYTPGFIEIEHWYTPRNTSNYINGALIGGRGMLLGAIRADGGNCTGGTFISFDPKTIDGLGVYVPSMIQKVGYTVLQ